MLYRLFFREYAGELRIISLRRKEVWSLQRGPKEAHAHLNRNYKRTIRQKICTDLHSTSLFLNDMLVLPNTIASGMCFCKRIVMVNISRSHRKLQVYFLDWKLDDTSVLNTSLSIATVWKAASQKQGWIIKVAPIKTAEPAWGTAGFALIPHRPIHPSNRRTANLFSHLFFLPPPAVCTAQHPPPALTPPTHATSSAAVAV